MRRLKAILLLLVSFSLISCNAYSQKKPAKTYHYTIEETLPHDETSYTQGLFFYQGGFYESAGQYGTSSFRKVDLKTGKVLSRIDFPAEYFIEGSCALGDRLFILTWQENTCFVYNIKTMQRMGTFKYPGEGWGLTTDGKSLIMSDGTSRITFRNPLTFMEERSITVTLNGKNVVYLNELEYIKGEIWANVYLSNLILRIDPKTGIVNSVINCTGLLPSRLYKPNTDVLNGIAYDEKSDSVYLTGKNWPHLYKISLK